MLLAALPPLLALTLTRVNAHRDEFYYQQPMHMGMNVVDVANEPWTSKYGAQRDLGYTGPLGFAHLPYSRCLDDGGVRFDIGLLGMPFDTKTSYRPGKYLRRCETSNAHSDDVQARDSARSPSARERCD